MMSGVMPNCSWQKNVPLRPIPACTSSRTIRALCLRQRSCASSQNSSGARLTPLPWMGSITKRGDVAGAQLAGQRADVAEGDHVRPRQQRAEAACGTRGRR